MKTIAISVEEALLKRIEGLLSGDHKGWKNRSQLIQIAVKEFIARLEEEREREIFHRYKNELERQSRAVVRRQAKL